MRFAQVCRNFLYTSLTSSTGKLKTSALIQQVIQGHGVTQLFRYQGFSMCPAPFDWFFYCYIEFDEVLPERCSMELQLLI